MTDQEVQLFLADLAIIILLARLLGMAAKRLGQPPVLGEIIPRHFIRVLSAVSHGMPTLSLPERMPSDGEFVAVRVLSGASRTNYAPRAARDLQRSPVV